MCNIKKVVIWVIGVIVVLSLIGSGWVYSYCRNRNSALDRELATLTATFNQQYGTDGIKVNQMLANKKVYTAVWESKDGATHISWNVGGLWVTVWDGNIPAGTAP